MSSFHSAIPVFVPASLESIDQTGASEIYTIDSIDKLAEVIYEDSTQWWDKDNEKAWKSNLIDTYNHFASGINAGNHDSIQFEMKGARAIWSELV